jgi:hypothetical protein
MLARLSALAPRPRAHLLTYLGVLAPAAAWRDHIVPGACAEKLPSLSSTNSGTNLPSASSGTDCDAHSTREPARPRRHPWAAPLKRVFELDVLVCPHCQGRRSLIAFLTDGPVARKILLHLGLDSELPLLAPARALEDTVFAWWAGKGAVRIAGIGKRALEAGAGAENRVMAQRECGHDARHSGWDGLQARRGACETALPPR